MMEEFLDLAQKEGADYCELNHVESSKNALEISNKKTKDISTSSALLNSARILISGRWGNSFSFEDDYKTLIRNAIRNARTSGEKSKWGPHEESSKKRFQISPKEKLADIDLEQKKDFLLESFEQELKDEVTNLSIYYTDLEKKHTFMNSLGSVLSFDDSICSATIVAYAKSGERMESSFESISKHGGFEVIKNLKATVKKCADTAVETLSAKSAKGGMFDIVVDQDLGGVFTHEAVGHACEADLVLADNSILKDKIGKIIANESLTIYDDGNNPGWGHTPFDNEGVLSSKTPLIEKGELKGFLHSRETAHMMGTEPTGNGRSQGLQNKPIPRMTNTYIENGDAKFDDMISEIKEGYYLKGSYGGQVDTNLGEFLFNAKEGFYVKGGVIIKRVKGASMLGNVMTTMKNISMVGNDLAFHGGGACGKSGQSVLTGEGCPHLLIKDVIVGGQK